MATKQSPRLHLHLIAGGIGGPKQPEHSPALCHTAPKATGSRACQDVAGPQCCTRAWLQVNTDKQMCALKKYLCDMQHSRPVQANVKLALVVSGGGADRRRFFPDNCPLAHASYGLQLQRHTCVGASAHLFNVGNHLRKLSKLANVPLSMSKVSFGFLRGATHMVNLRRYPKPAALHADVCATGHVTGHRATGRISKSFSRNAHTKVSAP